MPRRVETEVKLAIASPRATARRLRQLGFRLRRRRQLEITWIFDDARGSLRRAGRLLRLRRRGATWMLTAKGPRRPGRFKTRPEVELPLPAGGDIVSLLAQLGLHSVLEYRRYRTVFADARGEAGLDEASIGCFLELEGPPRWIDRTARAVGYAPRDYILRSYPDLFARRRAKR